MKRIDVPGQADTKHSLTCLVILAALGPEPRMSAPARFFPLTYWSNRSISHRKAVQNIEVSQSSIRKEGHRLFQSNLTIIVAASGITVRRHLPSLPLARRSHLLHHQSPLPPSRHLQSTPDSIQATRSHYNITTELTHNSSISPDDEGNQSGRPRAASSTGLGTFRQSLHPDSALLIRTHLSCLSTG